MVAYFDVTYPLVIEGGPKNHESERNASHSWS